MNEPQHPEDPQHSDLSNLTAREVDMLPTALQQEWFRQAGLGDLSREEQAHILALDLEAETHKP